MAKIYVSWVDKRHVVLRSELCRHGAENYHFTNEGKAEKAVNEYLAYTGSRGWNIKSVADREWELTK